MKRHVQETYYVVNEGELGFGEDGKPAHWWPSAIAEPRRFRFSRLGDKGPQATNALLQELAKAMTARNDSPDGAVPAGFTYLGQFVDHDLTLDRTAVALGDDVTVAELVQGRSPSLDLDSVYGRGPAHPVDKKFYAQDGIKLKIGTTVAIAGDAGTNVNRTGFDLPRVGIGPNKRAERQALIPDARNDENLAVAQTHVAFLNFHNRVVDRLAAESVPSALLFERARAEVVRHYQWMLREDFLPRIVNPVVVSDVFTNGRKYFDPDVHEGPATMPIEFSVAAYRIGHSMVRDSYSWNRIFEPGGITPATLFLLFTFTGTAGILTATNNLADLDNPNAGSNLRLPTNWIVDWRRLHDFRPTGRPDLFGPGLNPARRIDTLLANGLGDLPAGTFGGTEQGLALDDVQRNLAYRNLKRANMVELATGQQMAQLLGATPLTRDELITGSGGASLAGLDQALVEELVADTPLWFYVLREAELHDGHLNGVGGRIVAEVFHRCMEAGAYSILREPEWRPTLGEREGSFTMADLLLVAADGKVENLNPLGDKP
ncbi:heme peroxidase family protein [Amycolatopsis sp.]|uniref:peroxidase family protein n=1 Tax=Amycolatopsis sp. TaxID=37632 RepID=UPI002CDE71AF|nr:heme peroxidase family protein [Amycolatopsis sp.]HVV10029.1 heme peroxidase family protein [Amycolatopsis sp.]